MISEKGLAFLKKNEGFSPLEYTGVSGKRIIGFGHKASPDEKFPCGISEKNAEALLQKDVAGIEKIIASTVKVPLTQKQFDALVSFVFDIGERNFKHSAFLKALNARKYDVCPAEIRRWIYVCGRPCDGLVKRRKAESELFRIRRRRHKKEEKNVF